MDLNSIKEIIIPIAQAATEAAPHAAEAATQVAEAGAHAEASGGVIGTLGINLRYFIAQLINFGVVLFVLWKWVLTPVANKLTERTARIEKAMEDANTVEKEKQEFAIWKEQEMNKARQEAGAIVASAQKDAGVAKDEILYQTKLEQEKLILQAKKQIEQEKTAQLQNAKAELADLITGATEKILRSKLDDKKDKELIRESLKGI